MRSKTPLISIVVCSYNGASCIKDTLMSVMDQKYKGKYETIVVDDGSNDDTYKIAKTFKKIKAIKNKENKGLAESRNIGIKAAKGDIIAFTDDDCILRQTWLKEIVAGYKNDKVLGVGGPVISTDKHSLILRYLNASQPHKPLENNLLKSTSLVYRFWLYLKGLTGLSRKKSDRSRSVYSLLGGNMSFRKTALEEVKMFDGRFRFGGEEEDLCKRINTVHPKSLRYAPKAKLIHQFDDGLRVTLKRSQSYGIGNARMYRKHEDVKPVIFPFPPLVFLSFFLGLVNPLLFLSPLVLVQLIYSKWLLMSVKNKRPEVLLYGYIQCLQEWNNNIGFIKGWWRFRNLFKKPKTGANRRKHPYWTIFRLVFYCTYSVLLILVARRIPWLGIPLSIFYVFFPGYLIMRILAKKTKISPVILAVSSIVVGLFYVMLSGFLLTAVLPVFGVNRPFDTSWLVGAWVITTTLLMALTPKYTSARKISIKLPNKDTAISLGLALLSVLLSVIGVQNLNSGHSNAFIMLAFVIGISNIVFIIVRNKHLSEAILPIGLFALSLVGLWSYSLRSSMLFGWDIQQEYHVFLNTLNSSRWILGAVHQPYDAMLSLTILPVSIARFANINGLVIFKVLFPLLFSFVPVIIYYLYREFSTKWVSFLAAALVIAQFPYMQQFPALARQEIAFIFFAYILYIIFQQTIPATAKKYLLVIATLGLVFSHYSTTYFCISLLLFAYIISKLNFNIKGKNIRLNLLTNKYIKLWTVILMIISAFLWYGPITNSSGEISRLFQKHDYSHLMKNFINTVKDNMSGNNGDPQNTQSYLQTIGKNYHDNRSYLTYYSGASNVQIKPSNTIDTKPFVPILGFIKDLLYTFLRYLWWIVGGIAILVIFLKNVRSKADHRYHEFISLGLVAIASFLIIHIIPPLQNFYNISRLNEQALILVSLPFIISLTWMFKNFPRQYCKTVATVIICLSFLFATGIMDQFFGGTPSANLNNYGADYDRFYAHKTDIASARWLDSNYKEGDAVFADTYSNLRLTYAAANVDHDVFLDLTPETIAKYSYVYADYSNIVNNTASSNNGDNVFVYSFPKNFVSQNKNLVYTNKYSEIYK